jgi:hypothetical protein
MQDVLSITDRSVLFPTILAKPVKSVLREKGTIAFQTLLWASLVNMSTLLTLLTLSHQRLKKIPSITIIEGPWVFPP